MKDLHFTWRWRIAALVAIALLATFVWPTPYWYVTGVGANYSRIFRVNRFTGRATLVRLHLPDKPKQSQPTP